MDIDLTSRQLFICSAFIKLKVLQINKFFYLKGGSEAYLFSLVDALTEMGHTAAEFAMRDPKNRPSRWAEFFVDHIDYSTAKFKEKLKFATKIIYSFEARNKIALLLDAFQPDIVHLHMFQHQISASILPKIKKRGIPVVYTAHDLKSVCPNYKMLSHGKVCERCKYFRYFNCTIQQCVKDSYLKSMINTVEMYFHLFRGYYDLIDHIITPSDFYRQKLVEWRFPETVVSHIPNFVDEAVFAPIYGHDPYFLYFGRLSEEKGVLTLVEAMRYVKKGTCVIAGSGPILNEINTRIGKLGLTNVKLVGFKSGNDLKKLIRNSMFVVLPSEWYENGPISLLESFAYGKPVIGSNIGGIPEHIEDGVDGFLFECGNADELADRISKIFDDPDRAIEMGKNARKKIENLYSLKTHMEGLLKVYDRLVRC